MSGPIRILQKFFRAFYIFSPEGSIRFPKMSGFRLSGQGRIRSLDRRGFTLLEMLVSLTIATLIVGGVMGLISVSMQHKFRIREKGQAQPILESAAQIILADPARVMEGNIRLAELPGSPVVGLLAAPVQLPEGAPGAKACQLYRVMLTYGSGQLEFSVIVPPSESQ